MGIAVRKAGTVVRCPKCAGDIIVPTLEPGVVPEPDDADDKFEDSDFERKLQDIDAKTTKELPGSPTKRVVPTPIPVPPRRGIFLSTGMLFLSISVIVVLLVLVFILGVAVSRNSAGP